MINGAEFSMVKGENDLWKKNTPKKIKKKIKIKMK